MTRFAFITRILAALPLLGWLFRERETVEYPYDDFPDGEHKATRWRIEDRWEDLDVPDEWDDFDFPDLDATTSYQYQYLNADGEWSDWIPYKGSYMDGMLEPPADGVYPVRVRQAFPPKEE